MLGVSGERGCLGAGCVVQGGGLPVWLGGAVAQGGVSVGFDVGDRVFTLGGVSVPVSGSGGSVLPVHASGSVAASVGSSVSASVPGPVAGGVRVCVPCARAVFGDSWCSLVLRRWVRAAGVDGAKVDALLGSAPVSGSGPVAVVSSLGSGSVSSVSSPAPLSGSVSSVSVPVSFRSSAGGGRVGAGFGARVRDWGARVGVGGGVVSGGGVLSGWLGRWRSRVRALVSGVGGWGLVLLGVVGVVVLVSVFVLVG